MSSTSYSKFSSTEKKQQRGLALIVVLWVLAALSVMIASFLTIVRTNIQVANAEMKEVQFTTLLNAGLEITAFKLADDRTRLVWSSPDNIKNAAFLDTPLQIQISDPEGLIDLNRTDLRILQNLMKQFSGASGQVDTIIGEIKIVRDKAKPRPKGRQAAARQTALKTISRQVKEQNYPFMDLSQLNALPGMTPALYNKVAPFLTVYNSDGFINPATAPTEVLQAIPGVSRLTADDLVKRRKSAPGDQKIFSDFISRYSKYVKTRRQKLYIVYVSARWNQSQLLRGRRYVIGLKLNADKPYHLFSWSAFRA